MQIIFSKIAYMRMHCLYHYLIVTTLLVLNLGVIFPNNFWGLALYLWGQVFEFRVC
jgi:hypothetical protein